MPKAKVRRVRVSARLSIDLRNRLAKYCKGSGLSERTVIEDALNKYLHGTDHTALVLRRFDRVDQQLARERRDLELLSEAFGRYMRLWFVAHAPSVAEGGKAQARSVAEAHYKQFAQHLGAGFAQGRRFVKDVPVGPSDDEDEQA
jgi:hypothetical protein